MFQGLLKKKNLKFSLSSRLKNVLFIGAHFDVSHKTV